MSETQSPEERKQHKEKVTVTRDKASDETVEYLNTLRDNVDDPDAAEAIAMLHAQVNGDHSDYSRPPEKEPFGHWHRDLVVEPPTVTATTQSSITADVTLSTFAFYDGDGELSLRAYDPETLATTETQPVTVSTTGTTQFTLDGLDAGTEYSVQAVVTAPHETGSDTEYSDSTTATTDSDSQTA